MRDTLLSHIEAVHLSAGRPPPPDWLADNRLRYCAGCRRVIPLGRPCDGARCTLAVLASTEPPDRNGPFPGGSLGAFFPMEGPQPEGLELADRLRAPLRILRRVPPRCAPHFCRGLAALVAAFLRCPGWEAFARLMLFPRVALRAPDSPAGSRPASLSTSVRAGISLAVTGPWQTLMEKTSPPERRPHTRSQARTGSGRPEATDQRTVAAVRVLLAEGAAARAVKLLSSDGMHETGDGAVLQRLHELHPRPVRPVPSQPRLDGEPPAPESWPEEELTLLREAIRSFPPGGAAGSSGLRPQHLLDALALADSASQRALLASLRSFLEASVRGHLPPESVPWLCAARLFPLRKKDGGVRPIAVGETLRRLVAKWLVRGKAGKSLAESLAPTQVAFKSGGPCEVLAAGVQHLARELQGDWALLQVDVENAFNTVSREAVLRVLTTRAPGLLPWVAASFQPAPLFWGDHVVMSTNGVQQGDPLGPLLFAAALGPILDRLPPGCLLAKWYLDDGVLMGPRDALARSFAFLKEEFAAVGLRVNAGKSTLWGPGGEIPVEGSGTTLSLRGVTVLPFEGGTTVLGVPIDAPLGEGGRCAEQFTAKLAAKFTSLVGLISRLPDTQVAHRLLRQCLGPGRVTYALRCLPLPDTRNLASSATAALQTALGDLVKAPLTDLAWMQAAMPVALGGCGLCDVSAMAPVARLGGVLQYLTNASGILGLPEVPGRAALVSDTNLLTRLAGVLPASLEPLASWRRDGVIGCVTGPEARQHWWTARLHTAHRLELAAVATGRDVPRIESIVAGGGGRWMDALPLAAAGTVIRPTEYQSLLRWHLGLPVLPLEAAGAPCAACGSPIDVFGDHAVKCARTGFTLRHLGVQNYLCQVLSAAHVAHNREVAVGTAGDRPADIMLTRWSGGQDMAVDLTIVHPLAAGTRPQGGSAARVFAQAAEGKRRRYRSLCESEGVGFSAWVMDPWGGIHSDARGLWKAFTRKAVRDGRVAAPATAVAALRAGLGVALAREVARQLAVCRDTRVVPLPFWAEVAAANAASHSAGAEEEGEDMDT